MYSLLSSTGVSKEGWLSLVEKSIPSWGSILGAEHCKYEFLVSVQCTKLIKYSKHNAPMYIHFHKTSAINTDISNT